MPSLEQKETPNYKYKLITIVHYKEQPDQSPADFLFYLKYDPRFVSLLKLWKELSWGKERG